LIIDRLATLRDELSDAHRARGGIVPGRLIRESLENINHGRDIARDADRSKPERQQVLDLIGVMLLDLDTKLRLVSDSDAPLDDRQRAVKDYDGTLSVLHTTVRDELRDRFA
jgi:hypothetical protein